MIAPILEEIAGEHAGKLRIAKLNVDDNPDIARRFDVMSIPTMIVFKDGQAEKRLVGAKGKGQLLAGAQRVPVGRRRPARTDGRHPTAAPPGLTHPWMTCSLSRPATPAMPCVTSSSA